MEAYCSRQGLQANAVRFLYDGERLKDDATPALLNMEDQVWGDFFFEKVLRFEMLTVFLSGCD